MMNAVMACGTSTIACCLMCSIQCGLPLLLPFDNDTERSIAGVSACLVCIASLLAILLVSDS